MRFLHNAAKLGAAAAIAVAMTAAASADNMGHMNMGHDNHMGMHMDPMHDHAHHPAMRSEHRPPMPHHGMHWRNGDWAWHGDHWIWVPGIWIR